MDVVATVAVRGSRGTVDVLRGEDALAVLVHGDPAVIAGRDRDDPEHVWLLRAFDADEVERAAGDVDVAATDLLDALEPVLAHLAEGTWRVLVSDVPDVSSTRRATRTAADALERPLAWAGLHGADGAALVGTVPRDLVDERRVGALTRAIRAGARPAVVAVTAEGGEACCVVAGHAALEAWRRLGEPPLLVLLERLDPARLDAATTAALLAVAEARVTELVRARGALARSG